MKILALGAGVQSTTLALLAETGGYERPDAAIFSDTQWEPRHVYDHLHWLCGVLSYPVHIVTAGNLRDAALQRSNTKGARFASIPWHISRADGSSGIGRRQCTREYKIAPMTKKIRELLGVSPRARIRRGEVAVWLGISIDEVSRMKPARQAWQRNCWPLIELGMSRHDCTRWLEAHGYPIPGKSACIGCPFHDNATWRGLRSRPDEWEDAVAVDRALRGQVNARGIRGTEWMHRACVPLDQVDLSTSEDRGQLNLFENECEGICGV